MQNQKIFIEFALFEQLNVLVHYEIIFIDTFVCIEIIDDILAETNRNRFTLLGRVIVVTPFAKVSFLAVERQAIIKVVLVPVLTIDKILALAQWMISRIQGFESRIEVQCLLASVGHVFMINGTHGDGTAADAIVKRLHIILMVVFSNSFGSPTHHSGPDQRDSHAVARLDGTKVAAKDVPSQYLFAPGRIQRAATFRSNAKLDHLRFTQFLIRKGYV